jgi:hypothetical protein
MSTDRPRWQYMTESLELGGFLGGKVDQQELDSSLFRAGHDGWELVTMAVTQMMKGQGREIALVFKRPE